MPSTDTRDKLDTRPPLHPRSHPRPPIESPLARILYRSLWSGCPIPPCFGGLPSCSLIYRVASTTLKFSDTASVGLWAPPFRTLPLNVPSVSNNISLGDTKNIFKIFNYEYFSSMILLVQCQIWYSFKYGINNIVQQQI